MGEQDLQEEMTTRAILALFYSWQLRRKIPLPERLVVSLYVSKASFFQEAHGS